MIALDVEVGPDGVSALADLVGLVGLDAVHGVAVLVREDGDGLRAELVRGAEGPDRDLTPVGHENLGEHALRSIRPFVTALLRVDLLSPGVGDGEPYGHLTGHRLGGRVELEGGLVGTSFAMANVRISRPPGNPVSRSETSTRSATDAPNAAA